ncbi:MAG: MFS transporter [Candidatus Hodarchaeales archaeon]
MVNILRQSHNLNTFFGLSSFQILAMFRRGLFYSYLSIYLRNFLGLSVTETTMFATFPMILNVCFQMFVWGGLSDKMQKRRTLIIVGESLAGIGTIIVFLLHRTVEISTLSGWIIIIGLSIIEIFWSMSNTGWTALISDLYEYKERSRIQGQLFSMGGFGRILGVWIGGLLYDGMKLYYKGWGFYEGSLFYVAAFTMIISTVPIFFMPEGGIKSDVQNNIDKNSETINHGKNENKNGSIFLVFLMALVFINFGRNSIALIFSLYLTLETGFNLSSELLSYIINIQSIAVIISGLVVGMIGRKIGNGKTLLLGSVLASMTLTIISIAPSLFLIAIANFFRGCSDVIISSSSYAYASRLIAPEKRAKYFSYYNATFFLSWGLAGSFMAGPLIDILILNGFGEIISHQAAFIVAGLLTLIGSGILILLIKRTDEQ